MDELTRLNLIYIIHAHTYFRNIINHEMCSRGEVALIECETRTRDAYDMTCTPPLNTRLKQQVRAAASSA